MSDSQRNYMDEAEGSVLKLERAEKLLQLLSEELDNAHEAVLDDDPRVAAWWVSTRKDVMEAELDAVWEKVSWVRTALQEWINHHFGNGGKNT